VPFRSGMYLCREMKARLCQGLASYSYPCFQLSVFLKQHGVGTAKVSYIAGVCIAYHLIARYVSMQGDESPAASRTNQLQLPLLTDICIHKTNPTFRGPKQHHNMLALAVIGVRSVHGRAERVDSNGYPIFQYSKRCY
jgi:hypothetical protein